MSFAGSGSKLQINNEPYLQPAYAQAAGSPGTSSGNLLGFQPYYKNSSYSVEEVIVYSGAITTQNDSLIRAYLVNKYNNPKNKVLMGFGDSIMYGTNATNIDSSAWMALTAHDSAWDLVNWGYGGTVAVSRPGATGVPGRNGTDLYNLPLLQGVDLSSVYLVFEWGTNDVATDATWVTGYTNMIQAYLNAGIDTNHIYVCTMPARATGGVASLTPTYTTTYNNTLLVVANTHCRFYDNITYESSTWSASYMAVDGIHLTDAGEQAYKAGFEAVLK
jgi:lysophospholipase L1-like esterase